MKKRKFLVSLVAGILALIMVLGLILSVLPSAASASSYQDEIDDAKQQQEEAKQQQEKLKQELAVLDKQQDELGQKLSALEKEQNSNWSSIEEMVAQKDNLDQQINLLNTQIENINQQIVAYTQLIAGNQAELEEAQALLDELNEKHQERIRAIEEQGSISYWSVIFKSSSFTDLIDRLNMVEEIRQADNRRLQELDQAAKAVEAARTALEAEKAELESARAELDDAQQTIDAKRAEVDEILIKLGEQKRELAELEEAYLSMEEELSAQIAKTEKEYTDAVEAEETAKKAAEEARRKAEEARKKAEEEAKKKAEEEAKKNQVTSVGNGWYRPCAYKSLTSAYGYRTHPITGRYSFHNGVDLANDSGTPIYAAKTGTVTTATYNSVYGYYVVINHGDGYSTLYGHMTNYTVSVGDVVYGGQLIGKMGSTGWSTGPHLHYTIYYNGGTVNPADYL